MSNPNDCVRPEQNPASPPPEEQAKAQSGRDSKGRFARGNKGGPGNPFNRRVAALRQLLLEKVSDDDLGTIVDRLVEMAKEGDVSAARLVLSYTVGKPTSAVDPDELDIHEMDLYQRETLTAPQSTAPLEGIPAALAATIIRGALPQVTESRGETLAAGLRAFDESEEDDDEDDESSQTKPAADTAPAAANKADKPAPRRRESKAGKEAKSPEAQAEAREEFPSIEQILSWVRGGTMARVDGPAGAAQTPQPAAGPGADSKPGETARRAANPDQ